jgi:hypothetical protein
MPNTANLVTLVVWMGVLFVGELGWRIEVLTSTAWMEVNNV